MADDREARALGAGDKIEVDGKEYTLRPIRIQRLCDIERESLKYYKRLVLETYRDNIDLIEGNQSSLMEKKLEAVSSWTISDLPKKHVYDASNIEVTDEIREWVKSNYDMEVQNDSILRMLITLGLDNEKITSEEVKKLSGSSPRSASVRFDQWWITSSYEGMASFVFASVREEHPELTREDVGNWPLQSLLEAVRSVEKISNPSLGNG